MQRLAACLVVLMVLGWLSGLSFAQQPTSRPALPRFEFNGVHLGDPISDAFAKGRQPEKRDNGETVMGEIMNMGNEQVSVHYRFSASGDLEEVAMWFPSDSYPGMVKMFAEKLGAPPDRAGSQKQRVAAGVEVENEMVIWDIDGGKLAVKKYDIKHAKLGLAWAVRSSEAK